MTEHDRVDIAPSHLENLEEKQAAAPSKEGSIEANGNGPTTDDHPSANCFVARDDRHDPRSPE